ncbi:hypothetical protein KGM_213365 [Danaus plexippus plexippus]|uniref:Uncharacterized protein n=1 Tax=Danaus plexippus plexippus TaxID=278856 RepID=A0A212ENE5_DANPL|nr:hypothetical protein KGM_213365 [Danaus plexippus plexippus]
MKIQFLFLVLALLALFQAPVDADFYYNRLPYKPEDIAALGLKCMPGRTIIKVEAAKIVEKNTSSSEEETRRSHMNAEAKDELCQICVCSLEGKDEYCSRRPARNVNECIRMSMLNKYRETHAPFSHEKALSYRIRRDYLWHRDEIPYEPKASCKRGTSYYSNSVTANNTDIDVASDIDSLLDYSNKEICFYCVCSTDGRHAGCINRDPWFCEYYRIIRDPHAPRENYRLLFKQDRPAYFRQLSYRLRRTMDEGIDAFLDYGGDTLCCNHPDGHRRNLHEKVRTKIRLMRRKVPKENMMGGSPQGDYVDFIVNND